MTDLELRFLPKSISPLAENDIDFGRWGYLKSCIYERLVKLYQ